jgi:NAD(P)H-hydrate repair Nnr-like enzyme with NAD(P)H-hydrate dehydratase domain
VSNNAHELSLEDLEAEKATALPEREAMSKVDLGAGLGIDNFAMPINEATAMNINSTDAVAIADADQIVIITQADVD